METQPNSKAMHIALWAAQGLLAAMFLLSGPMKVAMSTAQLAEMLPWATSVPAGLVKFIGLSELLGGLGLVLPAALRIKPGLTAWAALGIAAIMLLAIPFHISRGETPMIGMNIALMLLAAFVAWGRWKASPILAK